MAEIEEIQVELESTLYSQTTEKLIELSNYFKLEASTDINKSKLKLLKSIRNYVEDRLKKEPTEDEISSGALPREEFLKDAVAFLVDQPPPLEKDQTDKEIALLEKMYSDLKIKQEQEMNDLKEKLSKLKQQKKDVKPSENEVDGLTEVKDLGQDNLQHGKEYGVKLGSSILKCEFKISGQIGEPSQTEKLTFVSLTHQIDSGLKRGYAHSDIIDAIIRSISPHSNLRSYIKMLPDLTLAKLRKILRLHYREKTASELYQELSVVCQNAKESPQQFLLRALGLRNKVQFASQEADSKFEYGFPLIQNTFLKSIETGLRDDILVTNLRPALHNTDLSDEDLMKYVNELATNQAERQSKLGSKPARSSAAVAITEPTQPKQNAAKESSQQNDLLLAEIREIKSDLSTLKQHVNFDQRPANRQS